ncbi:AAA family ATPase [Streptomyces capparidis]
MHSPGPRLDTPASRRTVSVVFCDMTGSTALSERLDPEALRHVMLRYFTRMRMCVEDHGGTVEKFIGDAVMAVFGVPVVHEDDALRAVRAALDMRASLDSLNAELLAELGTTVAVRIGVDTGEVVATVTPGADQALVAGETVNVAARLEQHAEPGEILVGAATRALVDAEVETEPVEPLTVRGISRPVPAWRVVRARDLVPGVRRGNDCALVDRVTELDALLREHRAASLTRTCRLVTLLGDPGVGKSRLARAYAQEALRRGALVAVTGCPPYGSPGPLAPLAPLLEQSAAGLPGTGGFHERAAAALGGGEAAGSTARLLDRLRRGEAPGTRPEEVDAALARLFAALGRDRTVVAVLDDAQWAEPDLLDAVERLAAGVGPASVVLLCVARTELLDHRPDWARNTPAGRLPLGPLGADDCRSLVALLHPAGEVVAHLAGDGVAERIAERAGGNPLFVEQIVAMLRDGGSPDAVPPSVRGVMEARLDRLPAGERAFVECAAVVGREVPLAQVRVVWREAAPDGADPDPLLAAVTRRGLLEPDPVDPSAHRFTSQLLQEVAYAGLPRATRAERHERLAAWLLDRPHGEVDHVTVGGHLERAFRQRHALGVLDRRARDTGAAATDHLTAAGAAALARGEVRWAGALLQRARAVDDACADDACADGDPGRPARLDLRTALAEALVATGRTEEAVAAFRAVHDEAVAAGEQATAARVRLQLAYLDPGHPGVGAPLDVARAALPVLAGAGDDLGLARAWLRVGQAHQSAGRYARALDDLVRALDHAGRVGAELERAGTVGALGVSLWLGPEPVPAALDRCARLLAAELDGRRLAQAALSCPMAVLLATRGRFDEARDRLALATGTLRDLGHLFAVPAVDVFAANVEALAGRWADAEALLRSAREDLRRLGDAQLLATATRDLARVLLDQGRHDEARQVAGPADAEHTPDSPTAAAELHALHGRALARRGDADAALAHLDVALTAARGTESPLSLAAAELDLAHALTDLARAAPDGARPRERARAAASSAHRRLTDKGHLVGAARAERLASAPTEGAGP